MELAGLRSNSFSVSSDVRWSLSLDDLWLHCFNSLFVSVLYDRFVNMGLKVGTLVQIMVRYSS
jgi:hypothetical protein